MGDQDTYSSSHPPSSLLPGTTSTEMIIPAPLKFLISNIKNLIPHPLTIENYAIWRIQVLQQVTANKYSGHLTGASPPPADVTSPEYETWQLVDSNLMSALFATITPSILPYVITATSAQEVWTTLERRLQPTNRSRVLQLKNELHHIQLKNLSMQQYLTQIKHIVDNIAAFGSKLDPEDIVHYILNGLPQSYNSFKTYIRTSPLPADLDSLYSLLCSEEIHVNQEQQRELTTDQTALYSNNNNNFPRGKQQKRYIKNKTVSNYQTSPLPTQPQPQPSSSTKSICQICGKTGHIAINCWHRCNFKFAPTISYQPRAMLAQPTSHPTQDWILDTGATTHLTPDNANLLQQTAYNGSDSISVANGSSAPIQHTGQGLLPLPDSTRKLHLNNLLHVPSLTHNLIFVSRLTKDNSISILFNANGFEMKDSQDNRLLLRGHLRNGLYNVQTPPNTAPVALQTVKNSLTTWYDRLGHPHIQILQRLAKTFSPPFTVSNSFFCKSCNISKSHKLKFKTRTSVTHMPFDLIHSDVWGPSPIPSLSGFRYYVIFTDDCTRFSWIYFMHTKQETFSHFQHLCKLVYTQFNKIPKILQSDGGGEFTSTNFKNFLHTQGIHQRISCPYTPEQNGLAERKYRHVLDLTRTLLHAANLPNQFWADAVSTAIHLINRLPNKSNSHTSPYQLLYHKQPSYDHLRVFGCLCYPWLKPYADNKLAPRSQDCIFIGYSPHHKGYKCFNLQTNKIHISRHVVFVESTFPYNTNSTTTTTTAVQETSPLLLVPTSTVIHHHTPRLTNPTNTITQSENLAPQSLIPEPTPLSVTNNQNLPNHPMQTRSKSGIYKPNPIYSLLSKQPVNDTPINFNQARHIPHWQQAMESEFQALQQQKTWTLVPAPPDKTILGCKWTYRTKLLPNGQIDRYKARLVALGYNQKHGENYDETFSPVAKMTTIRILLTVALNRKWPVLQLDVSNAFYTVIFLKIYTCASLLDFSIPKLQPRFANYTSLFTASNKRLVNGSKN
ncbi:hypothetical protein KFK09_028729 [Dendrobium nobile]|uniref:Retrovirus-related Pol polyprotein from transposon TNT 1-94 n=1 Tax=Dendrobium nobile TaxID=94219 RepID=A0A8T3A4A9_DENNO|nr:hypothetical protein KFK09_028729 [Dendrobium nobile]